METHKMQEQLRASRLGETSPWLRHGPRRRWIAPAFGLLAATWVLSVALTDGPLRGLAYGAHLVAVLGLWFHFWRARGPFPRGRTPQEMATPMYVFVLGGVLVGLGAWGLATQVSALVAAGVAAVAAWALFLAFEASYARGVSRLAARTGSDR